MPYYTILMFWKVSITHLYLLFRYFSPSLFSGSCRSDTWCKALALCLQSSIPPGHK